MHVKDLHVTRYGPMTPFEHDGFAPLTLVYGPNEQGKTLLIDALVKLLFKKELKKSREKRFGNMKRVTEQPEGYVVLQTHAEEIKLESDDTLSKFFPVELTPEDFRNVFLIRDSDLGLDDERDYYNHITEKLTGLRSSEITDLLKIIQRKGRLRAVSPDSALVNSVEQGKWADRMRAARRVIDQIGTLRDELAFSRYDELNQERVDLRRRRRELEQEREREREVERRRQLERARDALVELDRVEESLAQMRDIDYRTFKAWQRAGVEREHLLGDIERVEKTAGRLEKAREQALRRLQAQRAKTSELDRRLRELERELSQRVDAYQHDRLELRRWDTISGLTRGGFIASGALALVALAAYLVWPSWVIAAAGGVALLVALRTGWGLLRHRRDQADLDRRAEAIRNEAARLGLKVETVLDLQSAMGDLGRELDVLRDDERSRQAELDRVVSELGEQKQRLENHRRRVAEIDAEVAGFRSRTGCETLEDCQRAIDHRRAAESTRHARHELLQGLIPVASRGVEAVAEWRRAVEVGLADASGRGEGGGRDPDRAAAVEMELDEIGERQKDVETRLARGEKQIYNLQMKVSELRILDDVPRCRTLHDLDHLAERIAGFCRRIEHEQLLAQKAIQVFMAIESEERERVGDLFGPGTAVSETFRAVTDGRYRAVIYDVESDQILVERNDGKTIRATALSGGAFDQLYLSIRLGIAERLLPASRGFFIMDDPFIKADTRRLANLMDVVRRIVGDGWQVLYFSAKQEVLDMLGPDIDRGDARLIELDRTLFSSPAPVSTRPAR